MSGHTWARVFYAEDFTDTQIYSHSSLRTHVCEFSSVSRTISVLISRKSAAIFRDIFLIKIGRKYSEISELTSLGCNSPKILCYQLCLKIEMGQYKTEPVSWFYN